MKTTLTNSAPQGWSRSRSPQRLHSRRPPAPTQTTRALRHKPHGTLSARLLRVQPRRGLHDERLPGRAVLIIRGSNSGPLYRPTLSSCIVGKHV